MNSYTQDDTVSNSSEPSEFDALKFFIQVNIQMMRDGRFSVTVGWIFATVHIPLGFEVMRRIS